MSGDHLESLRPGSVHVFNPGNALTLGVGVWAKKNASGRIQIHVTGGDRFHTTITNDVNSERYHRTLFRNLRRRLLEHDAWPFGDEGHETETRNAQEDEEEED